MAERQYGTLEEIRADHVNRYRFAVNHIGSGKRVLDAACGCGYGSRMLQDAGNKVVGVDICPEAILYAGEHYNGVGYLLSDIRDKPWVGMFDAIVSFETIEHLPEGSLRLFRESVDGVFICSVPNQDSYPFVAENFARDVYPHLRHYTPFEFDEVLAQAGFKVTERYCQKSKKGEVVEGTDGMFLVYICQ